MIMTIAKDTTDGRTVTEPPASPNDDITTTQGPVSSDALPMNNGSADDTDVVNPMGPVSSDTTPTGDDSLKTATGVSPNGPVSSDIPPADK
jgi:hypothetical protein